jgi:hypothetical protein
VTPNKDNNMWRVLKWLAFPALCIGVLYMMYLAGPDNPNNRFRFEEDYAKEMLQDYLVENGEQQRMQFASCRTEDSEDEQKAQGVYAWSFCTIDQPASAERIYFTAAHGKFGSIDYSTFDRKPPK